MQDQCRQYQENFGTGTMPDEWASHAQQCPECQAFVQRQEALQQALSVWQSPPVSDDFALAVMSRLAETRTQRPGFWEWLSQLFRSRLNIPVPVGALAMALLIVSLMFNAYQWFRSPVTGLQSGPVIVNIPSGLPTPLPGIGLNPSLTSFGNQWSGAGAFLLIPMMDLQQPRPVNTLIQEKNIQSQDI